MEKTNLKEQWRRLLTGPERIALALTVLFLIAAAAVSLRPRADIRLEQGSAAQVTRLAPEPETEEAPVDLNTADCDALQTLPGIGPELAGRILAYRAAHGPFTDAAELLQVDGIGEKTLAGLLARVTVGEMEATP